MDLTPYFEPIDDCLKEHQALDSFVQKVYLNEGEMPDIDAVDIALIGLQETRGASNLSPHGVQHIREKLYALKSGEGNGIVADLGNLQNGSDLQETYQRIQTISDHLMKRNVLPLLIGGSHDLSIGQYKAYEQEDKMISLLNVDASFDLNDDPNALPNQSHLYRIFTHSPNYLFNFCQLAYQSYLVNASATKTLEQLNFNMLRLGEVRKDIDKAEAYVREADMLTFDLSAIKNSYHPTTSQVFGLTGEEACQIMWYAGMNDKLTAVGIYEYEPENDAESKPMATIAAVMIWYFIEGFKNRKGEKDFRTKDYIKYTVAMDQELNAIVFYKSRLSDRWWMEVPHKPQQSLFNRNYIVPCDYEDYELATQGEVPERWISTFSKM